MIARLDSLKTFQTLRNPKIKGQDRDTREDFVHSNIQLVEDAKIDLGIANMEELVVWIGLDNSRALGRLSHNTVMELAKAQQASILANSRSYVKLDQFIEGNKVLHQLLMRYSWTVKWSLNK